MIAQLKNVLPIYLGDMFLQNKFLEISRKRVGNSKDSDYSKRLFDVIDKILKNLGLSMLSFTQDILANKNITKIELSHLIGNHCFNEISYVILSSIPRFFKSKHISDHMHSLWNTLTTHTKYLGKYSSLPTIDQCCGESACRTKAIHVINASWVLAIHGEFLGFSPQVCRLSQKLAQHFGRLCSDTFDKEMLDELIKNQNELILLMYSIPFVKLFFQQKSFIPAWRNLLHFSVQQLFPYHLNGLKYERGNQYMRNRLRTYAGQRVLTNQLRDGMMNQFVEMCYRVRIDGYQETDDKRREIHWFGSKIMNAFKQEKIFDKNSLKCMFSTCFTRCVPISKNSMFCI